jgi:hypothetical protein
VGAPRGSTDPELGPASARLRLQLAYAVLALTVVTAVLVAGEAPAAVRAPFVLAAATLVPGFPLVARLPVPLPALLALDVCVSTAVEAALAFALVQVQLWYPLALGLGLGVAAAGGTLVTIGALRLDLAREQT